MDQGGEEFLKKYTYIIIFSVAGYFIWQEVKYFFVLSAPVAALEKFVEAYTINPEDAMRFTTGAASKQLNTLLCKGVEGRKRKMRCIHKYEKYLVTGDHDYIDQVQENWSNDRSSGSFSLRQSYYAGGPRIRRVFKAKMTFDGVSWRVSSFHVKILKRQPIE